jgi:hypothetical protein
MKMEKESPPGDLLMSNKKTHAEEEISIVRHLLKKDLELEPISSPSWEELNAELKKFINHLLNNDFERLLQGLYRIDVNEERVKEILNVEPPETIADKLTDLILKRQRQKAITRMQYR